MSGSSDRKPTGRLVMSNLPAGCVRCGGTIPAGEWLELDGGKSAHIGRCPARWTPTVVVRGGAASGQRSLPLLRVVPAHGISHHQNDGGES